MKFIYTLLIIFVCLASYAQSPIDGWVKSQADSSSLSYANVIVLHSSVGVQCDDEGHFILPVDNESHKKVRISYLGYQSKTISIDKLKSKLVIYLKPIPIELPPYIVQVSRNNQELKKMPAVVTILNQKEILNYPAMNTDDILQSVPGVYINRNSGIFSRNAALTMHGLSNSSQVLILKDGIPLNHSSGGTINWNLIPKEQIDRIEVIQGPASSLYGINAMGGVVNIITKQQSKTNVSGSLGYGSYNSYEAMIKADIDKTKNQRGWMFTALLNYRQGDGYLNENPDDLDSNDVTLSINEFNANIKANYRFSKDEYIGIEHIFYTDHRGTGVQVVEPLGSYDSYTSNLTQVSYIKRINNKLVSVKIFNQNELFARQAENLNSTGKYKLYHQNDFKNDAGLWMAISHNKNKIKFTYGLDYKNGMVSSDIHYRTSSDHLYYTGNMHNAGVFFQSEAPITNRIQLTGGFRYDASYFINGQQKVEAPTINTGFTQDTIVNTASKIWSNLNPKLGLTYNWQNKRVFISVSSGFLPPKIDDITKAGKISKGFKIPNYGLKPESLYSLETGFETSVFDKIKFTLFTYYSSGQNFHYLMTTGDSIETGADEPKPVYTRKNIQKIELFGIGMSAAYEINDYFRLRSNYVLNHSEIILPGSNLSPELVGKHLFETPVQQAFTGIYYHKEKLSATLNVNFIGKQWLDDLNTRLLASYTLFNAACTYQINTKIKADLTIQNLFNKVYYDRKSNLRIGRYLNLRFNFALK